MNIELLNVRIFITMNEVTVDDIGNHKASWVPYYSCYATVSAEAGKENTDAGMIVDNTKADFTIRWCKKAAALDSTHYRVEFNDTLHDITAIDHMSYKKNASNSPVRK